MGTILTGTVLLGIIALIIVNIFRGKKRKNCAGCSNECVRFADKNI